MVLLIANEGPLGPEWRDHPLKGRLVEGKVLVDGMALSEGSVVTVVTREPFQGVQLKRRCHRRGDSLVEGGCRQRFGS